MKKVHKKYIPKKKVPLSTLESKEVLVSKYFVEKTQVQATPLENKVAIVNLGSAEGFSYSSPSKSEISTVLVKEGQTEFLIVDKKSKQFMLTKGKLKQVLAIAPFLDRDILTEEDFKTILNFLQNHPEYQSLVTPQQEYFPFFPNPAVGSSSSHPLKETVPEGLTFSLSDFLAQQNKAELTPSPQDTTLDSDSSVEGEVNTSSVDILENPLFSVPKPEKTSQGPQFSAVLNQNQNSPLVIPIS